MTCASPSALRAASRPTTLSWRTTSSGVSSIRISRSSAGISRIRALRKVVLPVEVPPETRMFLRALHRRGEHAGDVAGVELRRRAPGRSRPARPASRPPRLGEGARGDIIVERQIGRDMLADRQRQRPPRRRRRDHLDPGAVGQGRGEQGMLAADPLVRRSPRSAGRAGPASPRRAPARRAARSRRRSSRPRTRPAG